MKREFVRIEDIKITHSWERPDDKRIKNRIEYIQNGGECVICVNKFNVLLDGYLTMLALMEMGYENVPIERQSVCARSHKKMTTYTNANLLSILYKEQDGYCYICERKCKPIGTCENDDLAPTIDHVIPKSKGGAKDITNTKMACVLCNRLKGSFTYSESLREVIKAELKELELL